MSLSWPDKDFQYRYVVYEEFEAVKETETNISDQSANSATIERQKEETIRTSSPLLQRIYRRADAARYVGMSPTPFDDVVRPHLTEIPIGTQGVGFDRIELDQWVDQYKAANGRPARKEDICLIRAASPSGAISGGSTNESTEYDFEKVLAQVTGKKLKNN